MFSGSIDNCKTTYPSRTSTNSASVVLKVDKSIYSYGYDQNIMFIGSKYPKKMSFNFEKLDRWAAAVLLYEGLRPVLEFYTKFVPIHSCVMTKREGEINRKVGNSQPILYAFVFYSQRKFTIWEGFGEGWSAGDHLAFLSLHLQFASRVIVPLQF